MQNILGNNWLKAAKYITALVQVPATFAVFYAQLVATGHSPELAAFKAGCSVLLMDVMLLWLLYVLESPFHDPLKKLPYVLSVVALTIANVIIGIIDEGIFAIALRVGLLTLVMVDVSAWAVDLAVIYFSREAQEIRFRNRQVLRRKRLRERAWKRAMARLSDALETQQLQQEINLLQLEIAHIPPRRHWWQRNGAAPASIPAKKAYAAPTEQLENDNTVNVMDEGIIRTKNGNYAWISPYTNETFHETATGKPYTERGAKAARTKHIKQNEEAW